MSLHLVALACRLFGHDIRVPTEKDMWRELWCGRCGKTLDVTGKYGVWR